MLGASVLIAGCGSTGRGVTVAGQGTAGYRVLAGLVSRPIAGTVQAGTSGWSAVPSPAGRWWITSSSVATFPRSSRVELLASGRSGVRFHLGWEETCGGYGGRHSVAGGSGGGGDLTLHTPALILVRLPARYGTYNGCYLAATVALHMRGWRAAESLAPRVTIVHYRSVRNFG